MVSPTHAEGQRITQAIRRELAAQGRLGDERELKVWVPKHLTEAERSEASSYDPGDMLQFHQNGRGHKSGERLLAGAGPLPLDQAARFQAYRPGRVQLAAGDRLRITANGRTQDGRHRLDNGALFTVRGFAPDGGIVLDNGWVVGRDFGHVAHGYVVTSNASQGKTVDRVLIGQSRDSLPASGREQFYVSVSRGREQALLFTDDKKALREAVARERGRLTATEVFRPAGKLPGREWLRRHWSFLRRLASQQAFRERAGDGRAPAQKEAAHERG